MSNSLVCLLPLLTPKHSVLHTLPAAIFFVPLETRALRLPSPSLFSSSSLPLFSLPLFSLFLPSSNMSTSTDAAQPLAQTTQDQTSLTTTTEAVALASTSDDASRGQPAATASGATELSSIKITLLKALKHFPDFPIPGIKFIDILPLFQDPAIHETLLRALELQVLEFGEQAKPDVIVGLDARGFLFGPSLALRLGASFVPVRKKGKMPGPCVTAAYEKEYGTDYFQMQEGAVKPGQKVLVVDDIIATGKLSDRLLLPGIAAPSSKRALLLASEPLAPPSYQHHGSSKSPLHSILALFFPTHSE